MILGGTGMLGHVLFTQLSLSHDFDVYATARTSLNLDRWFSSKIRQKIRADVNADNFDTVIRAIESIQPDTVINCIGLVKQLPIADEPLSAITINSLLPHRVSLICRITGTRLIHISTDCVFDGIKGNYKEDDPSDAKDLYGRSKFLGEVTYPHCITLRTSIIGHELKRKLGLIEWFLAQEGKTRGFTRVIYSGFPTVELARIISEYVLPNPDLYGMYQVASEAISKYALLRLVAKRYGKKIEIEPFEAFVVDRSMNSSFFQKAAGYRPPPWTELVDRMYQHYIDFGYNNWN